MRGVVLLLAAVIAAGWWLTREPWNDRLSPGDTARALQARLDTEYAFRCRRVRLQPELEVLREGTDYLCEPSPTRCRPFRYRSGAVRTICKVPGHPVATSYFVATDWRKITAESPMG